MKLVKSIGVGLCFMIFSYVAVYAWGFSEFIHQNITKNVYFFPIFVFFIVTVILYLSEKYLDKEKKKELMKLDYLIEKHFSALSRNIDLSTTRDDYGSIKSDGRYERISEFFNSVGFKPSALKFTEAVNITASLVEFYKERQKHEGFDPASIPNDGLAFEAWVAENLRKYGWDAHATVGSGDQGLDVVAEKDGLKVGIQCKLYAGTVGNKAVQEIISAVGYFDLDKAVVITNSTYSKSANDLAKKHDVLLLYHTDIPRFDELVGN